MGNSQDSINGYVDLKLPKAYNERPNPQLKELAYLKRFAENGMALEGKGGIILKNGKYQVHKFVHRLDPVYASIPVTWIKKNENNNQPIGLIQINDNDWDGSVPIMHATRGNVRFYGCCLDPDEHDADVEELNAKDGGMFDFNYTSFYDHWTKERNDQQGTGGCRIERHEFAHIETPLSREGKSGVFILGKLVDNDHTLLLTAFIIARGQTLFVPPHTIHTNDYQRGLWRTYLEIGDVDICDLVKRRGVDHKIERMRLNFYCGVTKKRLRQYDLQPLEIQRNKSDEHGHDMAIRRQHTLLQHLNDNGDCDNKDDEDDVIDFYCECGTKMEYTHSKRVKPLGILKPIQARSSVVVHSPRSATKRKEPKKKVQFNLMNGLSADLGNLALVQRCHDKHHILKEECRWEY
eukprot:CAMPEP_0201568678 /NCGR_PEP_ID=MMETSP0190_2-20130828/9901_1 /ASSEMBLY_ACC=CAM_ASM_000263 /TAXON_ID=37353 /ORGANISM="Rosalina sp." /LENGTH=405 /DNA_ID=CAMNT_0047990077 /DNA_START=46 /DNA_END=1264 /DNA_ORIENTATION=+